jgi:site-specific recombinase XerD
VQANRVLAMVKRLYVWAGQEELLTVDPAKSVRATGEETVRDRVLADSEVALIWRAADAVGGANGGLLKVLSLSHLAAHSRQSSIPAVECC